MAASAQLARQVSAVHASARDLYGRVVGRARAAHASAPLHARRLAHWHAHAAAEQALCAAAASAQRYVRRLPAADVARATPTLGAAVAQQLAWAGRARDFGRLRREGGKLAAGVASGAAKLRDIHAQTAADLDDSVYLWRGGEGGGGGGAAREDSDEDEGDYEEEDGADDDFVVAAPAAKKGGGRGVSKGGKAGSSGAGDGGGEWKSAGKAPKKKEQKKGPQQGRSRGGLVRKMNR
jgi:hypothetical protein